MKMDNHINVKKCIVSSCEYSSPPEMLTNIRFFKFPSRSSLMFDVWVNVCKIDLAVIVDDNNMIICEKHFRDQYIGTRTLNKYAFPELHLNNDINNGESKTTAVTVDNVKNEEEKTIENVTSTNSIMEYCDTTIELENIPIVADEECESKELIIDKELLVESVKPEENLLRIATTDTNTNTTTAFTTTTITTSSTAPTITTTSTAPTTTTTTATTDHCPGKSRPRYKKNYYCFFCKSSKRNNPTLRFFQFPKFCDDKYQKWINVCNLNDKTKELYGKKYVCSDHFCCYELGKKHILNNAVPKYFTQDARALEVEYFKYIKPKKHHALENVVEEDTNCSLALPLPLDCSNCSSIKNRLEMYENKYSELYAVLQKWRTNYNMLEDETNLLRKQIKKLKRDTNSIANTSLGVLSPSMTDYNISSMSTNLDH